MENGKQLVAHYQKPLKELLDDAALLVKSNMCPFKKPEDAMLALQAGAELGIGYTQAISNLYPINGRVTMGVHLRSALIQADKDIIYRVLEDYVTVYHFRAKGGYNIELTADELKRGIIDGTFQVIQPETPVTDYVSTKIQILKLTPPYMPVGTDDRRTIIEFEIKSKGVKEKVSYWLHEAYQAGLVQARPDTWGKHTAAMMYARCFARGSDRYCSHITKGIKDLSEMLDANNIDYRVDDKGVVTEIIDTDCEVMDNDPPEIIEVEAEDIDAPDAVD